MLTSAKKIMSPNGISDVVLLIFTAVSNIQENVVQGKPQVNISKTSYITEYGFPVSLECSIIPDQNFQTVHVFWTKYLSGRIVKVNKQISNPSLNITFPTFQDSGQYVCSAKDYQTTVHSQPINLTVIGDIPSVIVVSRFYKVQNGQNVTLGCNITAVPNHTNVYWRKQTSEFITNITSSDQRIIGMTNAKPSLTILSTRTNDSGLYTCYADNLVGSGYSMYTNLTVFGSVPVVTVKDFIITVEYGHSVTLDCNVTSDPPDVTVYWQKEHNGLITNITSTKPAIDDIATKWHSLTIEETKQSDSGVYICYAVNAVGLSHSNVINMTVEGDMNYPFVQINSESSIQVEYGGSLTLVSYIRSKQEYPILKIYWQYINNGILTRIDSKTNGRNVDNSSLSIMYITTSESGMYTCVATNVMGTSKSNSIDVNVNGALPIVQVGNRAYESVYGEDVTLVCGISSEPFINNVYWTKDANGTQTIINQRSVGFQGITPQNPSLIITFSTIYDSGEYTCFGTNAVGTSRSEPTSLLVTGDLPDVKAPIPTIEISFGDSVDLICNVKANPLHDLVYWEHNVTGVIRRIFKETDGANGCTVENPSLSIDYVTNTVSGLYTCFAKNVVGVSHSSAINVTVKGGLPEVVIDVRNYKTIYGKKIVLDCKVTAYPKVSLVYWQKQSNNVITTLYNGSVGTEGITVDFPSLVLTRPVNADSGIYTCFASNIAGTQKSLSTKLTVEGGIPIISIPSTSYTAYYGKPITMKCIVVSNPLPSGIFWHKINGQGQVKRINNVTLGISGSSVENPSLTIKFATPVDEGIYFCSAENFAGLTQSHRIKLTVHAGLPIVSVPLEPFVTGIGFNVVLQCSVISIPPVNKVYWQVEINNSTTIINDKSSFMDIKGSTVDNPSLTIQSASLSMSGQYTCFASNDIGTARSMSRMLKVVDTDAPNQTIRVTVDTSDDDTDTIVNGIIGSLSVLVGVGTIILAYMQFRYGTLDGCLSKCKIKNWCR